MLLNFGVGEDSWENRVLQDQTSQSQRKSVPNIHWKDCWGRSSNTLVTHQRANSLEETLIVQKIEGRRRRGRQKTRWLGGIADSMTMHFSRLWCWERLKAEEKRVTEDEMVGWHHRFNGHELGPGMLQSVELQTDRHAWVTEQQKQNITYHQNWWNLLENIFIELHSSRLCFIQKQYGRSLFPIFCPDFCAWNPSGPAMNLQIYT